MLGELIVAGVVGVMLFFTVAVAPGMGFGEHGEGFVRIAMVENEQRIRQAARNIKSYLKSQGVNVPPSRED